MTLSLCKTDDSNWKYGSAANQIHNHAVHIQNRTMPAINRFALFKDLKTISDNAKGIIHTVTNQKHPVDLNGKIITNEIVRNELKTLITDLRFIANKVQKCVDELPGFLWRTSFETDCDLYLMTNKFDFQKYEAFRAEAKQKCGQIRDLAKDLGQLLVLIEARIEQSDPDAQEKIVLETMQDRSSSKATELKPLLLKKTE
jgi:hypothetical protein